jgi:cytochrome oxidase Cu insertion factor (SCO1/SenC/PrrC family)
MAITLYIFWAVTWLIWVLLALAPSPESSPEWLLLTREVCFGSLPDQLPSAQGWISLAAPIPMLVALVAVYGNDLKQQFVGLRRPLQVLLTILPLFTVSYAGARVLQVWNTPALPPELRPLSPDYPTMDIDCPDFLLKDQSGQEFGRRRLLGDVTVLTFAYAHCQTVCPALLNTMRDLKGARKVVVTLDPWRDTCGNLSGIASVWDLGQADVLSGDPEQIATLTTAFNVPIERDEKTGEIMHPALVFVLDSNAQVAYAFNNPSSAWLEEAIKRARQR